MRSIIVLMLSLSIVGLGCIVGPGDKGEKGDPGSITDDYITSNMIKNYAVSLLKIDPSGSSDKQVIMSNGSSIVWGNAGVGTITEVAAGTGLTGGGTSGKATLGINTSGASSGKVIMYDGSNIVWALPGVPGPGSITTDMLQNNAVSLPKIDKSNANSGYVITYNGSSIVWAPSGVPGPNSITGTMIQNKAVSLPKIDPSGSSNGQTIKSDGSNLVWGFVVPGSNSITTDMLQNNAVTTTKITDKAVSLPKIDPSGATSGQVIMYNGSNIVWQPIFPINALLNTNVTALKIYNENFNSDAAVIQAITDGKGSAGFFANTSTSHATVSITNQGNGTVLSVSASGQHGKAGDFSGDVWVSGDVYANSAKLTSDLKYKKNITQLGCALEDILQLRGVKYEWKTDEFPDRHFNEGYNIGFIAQEVEKVIPEVVSTDLNGDKSIAYHEIIPLLLEAIKEQQAIIEKQQVEINNINQRIDTIEKRNVKLSLK